MDRAKPAVHIGAGPSGLTEVGRRVLTTLSYFNQSAKFEHIATVSGVSDQDIQNALEHVVKLGLVIRQGEGYSLSPDGATWASTLTGRLKRRVAERLAYQAYWLVRRNGGSRYEQFGVLESMWPVVSAALPILRKLEPGRLMDVCEQINQFMEFTGRWDEFIQLAGDAENALVTIGDFWNAGHMAYQQGYFRGLRGEGAKVHDAANRAVRYWAKSQSGRHENAMGKFLHGIGHCCEANGNRAALKFFGAAINHWERISADYMIAAAFSWKGDVLLRDGNPAEAERLFTQAMVRSANNPEIVAINHGNLADVALRQEDWPKAELLAIEALELSRKMGRLQSISLNYCRLAQALARQSRTAEALEYALQAVSLLDRLGSRYVAEAKAILDTCQSASRNGQYRMPTGSSQSRRHLSSSVSITNRQKQEPGIVLSNTSNLDPSLVDRNIQAAIELLLPLLKSQPQKMRPTQQTGRRRYPHLNCQGAVLEYLKEENFRIGLTSRSIAGKVGYGHSAVNATHAYKRYIEWQRFDEQERQRQLSNPNRLKAFFAEQLKEE